ncbi:crotonase/enoyl-CoA hydratase family protein [Sulfitobacter sp. JBTF-M27]|uniref:Crotonase/enoyl-CoA hydratase family protein n=1 Tax=Sulfitobacter sediminilitoris TaxID=2698830 RepID=A0A6P0CGE6_9RHOB|nr:crotonase/enoyl-CoA hydratase family protein [Sulfitobacter sediminilitoris]NEK25209.1 crotonase/enoyl-CoA hydratase family protein [Sulfitobacter sediminilitoris]
MISYTVANDIAVLKVDDGKMNVVNPTFIKAMNDALDKAEADKAKALVLEGRDTVFSAGFDLKEFAKGQDQARAQVQDGFAMLIRMLDFPRPVIAACKGHGIGMGIFLLMVRDYRVGAEGPYKYSMPESRIGMDLGDLLIALAKSRISPKYLTRMAVLSEDLDVQTAMDAGVLDEIVDAQEVQSRAMEIATGLAAMPVVFGKNKREIKATELDNMRAALRVLGG